MNFNIKITELIISLLFLILYTKFYLMKNKDYLNIK